MMQQFYLWYISERNETLISRRHLYSRSLLPCVHSQCTNTPERPLTGGRVKKMRCGYTHSQ